MDSVTVRRATHDDAHSLGVFTSRLLRDTSEYQRSTRLDPHFLAATVRHGIDRGDPILLATVSGAPVGLLLWVRAEPGPAVPENVLAALGTYVLPEWRKQGVSRLLRAEGVRLARELGYKLIVGTVHPENTAGVASLRGQGWKVEYQVVVKEL